MNLRTLLSFSAVIPFMALADVPANYPGLPFTEDGKAPVVPADGTEVVIKAADFDYVPGKEEGKANEALGQYKTYVRKSEMSNNYRPNLPVRITDNADHMENQSNGDWTCYTVDFPSDGLYKIAYTVSTGGDYASIYFSLDGQYNEDGEYVLVDANDINKCHRENPDRVCDDIKVENNGWGDYTTKYETFTVPVTAGLHVVRMHFREGSNPQNIYVSRVADMPEENYPFKELKVGDGAEIYFRDYDRGGEGKAYHNVYNQYYTGNGTYNRYYWLGDEIEINGQGAISNTNNGEWMAYTVDVTEAGNYTITLNYGADNPGNNSYYYLIDRRITTQSGTLASTGGWNTYTGESSVSDVHLDLGKHEIRFYLTGGMNPMKMTFNRVGEYDETKAEYQGEAFTDHSIPGIIEAENFDKGGAGVAFNNPRHDVNTDHPDGQIFNGTGYRDDAVDNVDMERKTFTENEQQVERLYLHYMNGNKWFNYTFANNDGNYPYKVYACIATHNLNNNSATVKLSFLHDMTKEYTSNVFPGQGWDKFAEVEFPEDVKLPVGQVTMHVSTPANLDYVRFESTNPNINTGVDDIAVGEGNAVVITGEGSIRVEGYEGVVEVIAVNGMTVARAAASETIRVAAGLYIVRAGAQAFKVAVR